MGKKAYKFFVITITIATIKKIKSRFWENYLTNSLNLPEISQ